MRGILRSSVGSAVLLIALSACTDESTDTGPSTTARPQTTLSVDATADASTTTSGPGPTTTSTLSVSTTSTAPPVTHHLRIAFSLGGFPFKTAGTWTNCVSLSDPSANPGTTVEVTDDDRAIVGSGTFRSLNEGDLTDPVLSEVAQYARSLPPGGDGECILVAEFDIADSEIYHINYGGGPGMPYTNAQFEKQGWYVRDGVG